MLLTATGVLAILSVLPQDLESRGDQDASNAAAIEDVEIMRRLLVEAIDEANKASVNVRLGELAPSRYAVSGRLVEGTTLTTLLGSSGSVTHSRGFKAPGVGVLLSFDVEVPTREVEPKDEGEPDRATDDEWERIKREVRTGKREGSEGDPMVNGFPLLLDTFQQIRKRTWTLDGDAIDSVVGAVFETLAHHGARIRDLDGNEPITVTLHLSPRQGVTVPYSFSVGEEGEEGEPGERWTTLFNAYGSAYVPPRRVVIQVRAGELSTSTNGGGLERLKRTARIHRY